MPLNAAPQGQVGDQPYRPCVTRMRPTPYVEQLLTELEQIRVALVDVLERSQIESLDLPSNFIGFVDFAWVPVMTPSKPAG